MKEQTPTPEMQALCSLTPGGSEFANDPVACVDYVRGKVFSLSASIVKYIKERNVLRNSHNELVEALKFLIQHSMYAKSFINRNNELLEDDIGENLISIDLVDFKIPKELAVAIEKAEQTLAKAEEEKHVTKTEQQG